MRLKLAAGPPTAVRLRLLWAERRCLLALLTRRHRPFPLLLASLHCHLIARVRVFVTTMMHSVRGPDPQQWLCIGSRGDGLSPISPQAHARDTNRLLSSIAVLLLTCTIRSIRTWLLRGIRCRGALQGTALRYVLQSRRPGTVGGARLGPPLELLLLILGQLTVGGRRRGG